MINFPSDADRVDRIIRATVKALMKGKGLSAETVAARIGMPAGSLYRKLTDTAQQRGSFKASEVAAIAGVLGVSVGQLYDGLGGTFIPPSGVDGWAPSESNRQPADYQSGATVVELRPTPYPMAATA